MTRYKVVAIAPTTHQYRSLQHFGMEIQKNLDGSFSSEFIFETREEAEDYLIYSAEKYYDEFEGQSDLHVSDIKKYGTLTIDAVTAYIEEFEVIYKWATRDRETGNVIDEFDSIEDAYKALKGYENSDKEEGIYIKDFYEVVEIEVAAC